MNFKQLTYVAMVERTGSINKAAQALYLSQPALSTSIKEFEKELGFQIFERTRRGIHVTREGHEFMRMANQILAEVELLQSRYTGEVFSSTSPILRIASGRYSFISNAILLFYQAIFEKLPWFSLSVNECNTSEVIDSVTAHMADIGVIHIKESELGMYEADLSKRGLQSISLFATKPCVVFRKEHPLASKEVLTQQDIFEYPRIRTTNTEAEYSVFSIGPSLSISDTSGKNIFTNNRCTLYDILSKSDAVFLGITEYSILDFHPELTMRAFPGDSEVWGIHAIHHKNMPLSNNAKSFIKILKASVSND